jgi:hypothetical protein
VSGEDFVLVPMPCHDCLVPIKVITSIIYEAHGVSSSSLITMCRKSGPLLSSPRSSNPVRCLAFCFL